MARRLLALCLLLADAHGAHAADAPVKLVYFSADWCANCAVLGPAIDAALARVDGVERVDLDTSTAVRRAQSRDRAIAAHVANIHDAWIGATGFAALAAGDTGEVIGCVTPVYAAPEIEALLRRAVKQVRSLPPGARAFRGRSACPPRHPEGQSVRQTPSAG